MKIEYECSIGSNTRLNERLDVKQLQSAVHTLRDKGTVHFDGLEDRVTARQIDEILFARRPDLELAISSAGPPEPLYSDKFLISVSEMKHVKKLQIHCRKRQDFSIFGKMGQLEQLRLHLTYVPLDISFAGELPHLKFIIINSKCKGLEHLADSTSLVSVFTYSGNVDFTFAANLSIKNVRLTGRHDSWRHILKPCLKTLAFDCVPNLNDIDCISDCTGLEKLSIAQSKITTLPDFSPNKNLRELYIYSAKNLHNLENLATIPQLETLSIMEVSSKVNIDRLSSILLAMPNLKTIGCGFMSLAKKHVLMLKDKLRQGGREDLIGEPNFSIHYDFIDILEAPVILD
ncbi:hypothetical protein C4J81_11635 [Deltaproteobacteria bacterium Smac51]|nr:hypothetical protein C4J81_11635 [Deltaproteobacteria bacterium Smac51]